MRKNDISSIYQLEKFWLKNKKIITGIFLGIVVLIVGYLGYKKYIVEPKSQKAADLLYKTQQFFALDSAHLVLNGDGNSKGALHIIKNYGSTSSGNLAKYYAGISYLKLKDYKNAIKYLKAFSTYSKPVQMLAYTNIAHAFAELKQYKEAVEYYKKATKTFDKEAPLAAENLFYAGQLYEIMNQPNEALKCYQHIKEYYPETQRGYEIDKYIYKLKVEPITVQ